MRDFRRAEMAVMRGGYGYEVPCTDVFEPEVAYYIVVFAPDGSPVGSAGTQRQPVRVPIVSTRTQPEPALPGRPAPQQCSADEECPPGMAGCARRNGGGGGGSGSGGMGDSCSRNSDCGQGLVCDDDLCSIGSGERDDEESGDGDGDGDDSGGGGEQARFFLDFGAGLGFGYVSGGPADQGPELDFGADPVLADDDLDPLTGAAPVEGVGSLTPYSGCDYDNGFFPDESGTRASGCEVRVETPGFLSSVALRFGVGYYVIPRLALSAQLRFQVATDPEATDGLFVAPFLGTAVGQIQLRPDQAGQAEPFLRSGLNSAQLGSVVGFHITKNFGVVVVPEVHLLFPDFLFNFDVTLGVQAAF
jgi:hypothetical protein